MIDYLLSSLTEEKLKGALSQPFWSKCQVFYKEPGLNMNCSYNSEEKILRFFPRKSEL